MDELFDSVQPIAIVRGTTNSFGIVIKNVLTGEPYTLETGEVLRFGVKRRPEDAECLFTKEITEADEAGFYLFTVTPSDTLELDFGIYFYDVGLQDGAAYYPIIAASPFEIAWNITKREGV